MDVHRSLVKYKWIDTLLYFFTFFIRNISHNIYLQKNQFDDSN